MREKCDLLKRFNVIWVVQSPLAKIFRLCRRANHLYDLAPFRPARGTYRHRHETLGAECGGRDGVVARFWRARRATTMRTAKSCGPDAPTLASSRRKQFRRRRWQKSPVTGESAKETVKTIAQGRPGISGEPVVTMLVCFIYFAREAAGASNTRLSLRPLLFSREKIRAPARALSAPRECGVVSDECERATH